MSRTLIGIAYKGAIDQIVRTCIEVASVSSQSGHREIRRGEEVSCIRGW